MMGPDIGRHLANQIGCMLLFAFLAGALVFGGGWWLASFIAEHVSISWQ